MTVDTIDKNKCTGCKMCADICPRNAISFSANEDGFWYPTVDAEACVQCGACLKRCPAAEEGAQADDCSRRVVYAAWNRDESARRDSTSGGVYRAFAERVIANGGFLVGSVYSEDFCSARHICSDDPADISRIMGSKYFQSDTAGIYKKTKELLQTGREVLFCGTPCQVSALKRYLGEDHPNLISVDFICRGIPSPKLQQEKVRYYEKKAKSRLTFFRAKCDKYAWTDFGDLVRFENGKELFVSRWDDHINECFISRNLNLRESCYRCELKDGRYRSDLTMGDFWGIREVTEKDQKCGVSALIVNTEKGRAFLDSVGRAVYLERRTVEEVRRGNPAFVQAPDRPKNRDKFFRSVSELGLDKAAKKFTPKSWKRKLKLRIKAFRARHRKWLPVWKLRGHINWFKFIRYNYFCRNVKRDEDAFLIPCHGSVLQIDRNARLILHGNVVLNYYPYYKRGSQTTLLRVGCGGTFIANNRVNLSYGNTISVGNSATFETGYINTNIGVSVICQKSVTFGNKILLGRDACVYDSDFHHIFDDAEGRFVRSKRVVLEDGVWIGARCMVLKGATVRRGAIVGANSTVTGEIPGERISFDRRERRTLEGEVFWER